MTLPFFYGWIIVGIVFVTMAIAAMLPASTIRAPKLTENRDSSLVRADTSSQTIVSIAGVGTSAEHRGGEIGRRDDPEVGHGVLRSPSAALLEPPTTRPARSWLPVDLLQDRDRVDGGTCPADDP